MMGLPPMRIEVLNAISGVEFQDAFEVHVTHVIDGIEVPVISLHKLLQNKRASGRHKDLADVIELEKLEGV